MDIKDIQNLIRFVSKAEVAEVSIKQDDIEIKIKTLGSVPAQVASQQIYVPQAPVAPIAAPQASAAAPANNSTTSAEEENSNLITVKSPMIGTFYRSAGPGKEPFINVGDAIAPGKVLCIVEAMKLFNEIESEVSGKIVKILVDDASPVEYDQPLFLVDPA
ncbi:MAG TPA: acetyl-CoA carboxylase biotin carboxyl carrier protein [Flavobacteriaceae bacterium]|nr:acetyl-CoA carboxylase biotin carboxyl carrier protein [Flavobacteriaceae bacterium]